MQKIYEGPTRSCLKKRTSVSRGDYCLSLPDQRVMHISEKVLRNLYRVIPLLHTFCSLKQSSETSLGRVALINESRSPLEPVLYMPSTACFSFFHLKEEQPLLHQAQTYLLETLGAFGDTWSNRPSGTRVTLGTEFSLA